MRSPLEGKGFPVVKRRWVVERTLSWLMQHRRLVRDYQARPAPAGVIDNLTRRLTVETRAIACSGSCWSRP
jgi:transposase